MNTAGGLAPPLSTAKLDEADILTQIDNLIALHLHLWPALTAAIQNGWGTSSPEVGEDKRAWLAGSLSDMFAQNQLRDVEDVEDVLEQVMSDEFEVVVDDGSLEEVARNIWAGRTRLLQGDTTEVTQLMGLWEERQKKKQRIQLTQGPEVDQETDEDEDDVDEAEIWNGFKDTPDVQMGDAPPMLPHKKPEPEIDEDGFTKVVGKKKK